MPNAELVLDVGYAGPAIPEAEKLVTCWLAVY